ncbi:MAG: hypothetical protein K0S29_1218 [Gammaproteobacteria bacterium]|jgi:hypothetical protein|nr:hypothetical protein [Gammaproteobacteria bacterium]
MRAQLAFGGLHEQVRRSKTVSCGATIFLAGLITVPIAASVNKGDTSMLLSVLAPAFLVIGLLMMLFGRRADTEVNVDNNSLLPPSSTLSDPAFI